ncbi:sulfite exporter TauE/SafE family protein [Thauera butanivorans]|jgi:sulfite exporter TauE/SafE|uniref:sulfite exporter TauE/SafE family protein n=1 Tax=Thauera butanivorans TaxID=86174 RepID=UPI000837ADE9|nr:sulfite exporter TauE/SafE family protein [Thauera butanivorans]
MPETGYFAVFLIGLLGGTHCVSMCGGIVGALTAQVQLPGRRPQWPLHLAYSVGRITTYTALGGVVGALGSVGMLYDGMLPVQMGLYVLANLMLIALGLYLTGFTRLLVPVERAGHVLWRRIQPATRHFLPARSVKQALPLGLLWGFIPCGLTYSILATALVTGSGVRGAGLMLAFGLGTLPNLLLAGMLFKRFRDFTRNSKVRFASGLLVLGFGVFGLIHAPTLGGALWEGVVCLT